MTYILPIRVPMGESAGTMRITCLHTLPSSISAYEAACPENVRLIHHVRSDLFVRAAQGVDPTLEAETSVHLQRIRRGSDAVMLTCSLLAPAAKAPAHSAVRMMADVISERTVGQHVEVMYVAPRELEFATSLFGSLSGPASVRVTRLPWSWDRRSNPADADFIQMTRTAIRDSEADAIALIHSGMAQIATDDPRVIRMPGAVLSRLAALGVEAG